MNVPLALSWRTRWINWRFIGVDKRKVPFNAVSGEPASSTDSTTWATLKVASQLKHGSLGFVFASGDGLVGIDLDGCLDAGHLAHWASTIVGELGTYAEVSPSGTGLKLWGYANLANSRKKKLPTPSEVGKQPGIEIYNHGRYFAFTGNHWAGTPEQVCNCQTGLDAIIKRYWPVEPKRIVSGGIHNGHTRDVLSRAEKYVSMAPGAVSGQGGHDQTFGVACSLIMGFELTESQAMPIMERYNERCNPRWSERELVHKLKSAEKQGGERGYLLNSVNPNFKPKERVMASFNRAIIVGNLTRDVEVRYLGSGTAVCDLSLAVNEKFKDKAGEWKEEVSYIDVTCWGRTAEIAGEFLSKGSSVLIEGKLKQERWEKDGTKHSKIKIVCEQMKMLGGKSSGGEREEREETPAPQRQSIPVDDIPFLWLIGFISLGVQLWTI